MSFQCQICGEYFPDGLFKKHPFRAHGHRLEEYFHQYVPRHDKLTKELIPFKNIEQYLSADFSEIRHLTKWLKQAPKEESQQYIVDWLKKRKEK